MGGSVATGASVGASVGAAVAMGASVGAAVAGAQAEITSTRIAITAKSILIDFFISSPLENYDLGKVPRRKDNTTSPRFKQVIFELKRCVYAMHSPGS
jgi:hypothetical protein